MGSAQQGQVGQVGGAAMEPVAQVVGVAPGQGAGAVGEDTAAVPHGQGGALGGLDDPGGPSDLQGLGGGATQGRRKQPRRGSEPGRQGLGPARVLGGEPRWVWTLGWLPGAGVLVGVVLAGVLAGDHDRGSPPHHKPAAGTPRGPGRPSRPLLPACGWPSRLSKSTVTVSWGRTPPIWGADRPPGGGGPARPEHRRCVGCHCGCRGRRLGGPTVPGRPADSGRPRAPTAHPPRPCRQRSGPATTPGGHDAAPDRSGAVGVGDLEQVPHDPPQPAWVQLSGRLDQHRFRFHGDVVGQVLGAGGDHLGMGDRELALAHSLGGFGQRTPEQGPGRPDRPGGGADSQPEPVAQPRRG